MADLEHPLDPAPGRSPVSRRAAQAKPGGPGPSALPPGLGPGGKSSPPPPFTAAAGKPSPVTAPEAMPGASGAARGRAQTPAGASLKAHGSHPARSRTYTITLPAGLPLLNLNDRGHWAARYRRSEALKKAAWTLALQQKIPRLERVSVLVEYQPGDLRRRDGDNIAASAKALIDGLRAAGVLPEDDSRHVTEVTCRIGSLYPKGRLVLHLTEVPAAAGGDAA